MKVVRMVLNFKIDEEERIWFLFCSSLRSKTPTSVLQRYHSHTYAMAVYESPQIQISVFKIYKKRKMFFYF